MRKLIKSLAAAAVVLMVCTACSRSIDTAKIEGNWVCTTEDGTQLRMTLTDDGQHIPPGQQCVDDLLLTAPEGVIAEILLQNILLCHSRSPLFPAKHTPGAALRGMCVPLGSFLQVGHLKPAPRPSGALPACQFKKSFRFLEREG